MPDSDHDRHAAGFAVAAGDVAGAASAYEALLADCLRVLGADDPRTLTTRGNLASWRGRAGDVAGAVATFEALLADRLRVLGPDHPDTLATRNSLATWQGRAGDAAKGGRAIRAGHRPSVWITLLSNGLLSGKSPDVKTICGDPGRLVGGVSRRSSAGRVGWL
ncbi:tetratricopeptide repeat protein [Pseudofrankia saprophytica]|uniref:tetratricopeptide repeat protein n=1 Tax=Pseudofrankia saprophytica TaxID=298655 RepID=UPI0004879119|nr:tetratricopeptide repeat protein [Pseudofrankia saprophytica]OHV28621.1 hypothetical protein BCD49_37840 [Pseudofrankia sp. EUN1h]